MTIWTYTAATPEKPYWQVTDQSACFIEHRDGRREWRWIADGSLVLNFHEHPDHRKYYLSDDFKGKLLDRQYWPQWYTDMDVYGLDEGL